MNSKKKLFKHICKGGLLLGLVMSLSSCSLIQTILQIVVDGGLDEFLNENEYDNYMLVDSPKEEINRNRDGNKAGYNISLLDEKYQEGYEILPSIGEQKVLVIPVYFKDYTPISCIGDPQEGLDNINKAFFGEGYSNVVKDNMTGWESLKSYYYKSSYGKLIIDGKVTSWCPLSKTLEEVATMSQYNDPTIWVLREAVNWFKTNYPGEIDEYDQDNDGFIDAVTLIYPNEYYDGTGKQSYDRKYNNKTIESIEYLLWAYTYWDYEEKPNIDDPVANVYTWLSYDTFFDGEYNIRQYLPGGIVEENSLVDCHTLIHEFGHVLGLDDYYSYDYSDEEPLGRLDMMDCNIGDHNSYSKYLLNWVEPILIEEPGEYVVTSLIEDHPNVLLIPADMETFSYSPFSEYLLIEFYSPTGINEKDSKERYMDQESGVPYLFSKPGVKILHVDSRLVVVNDFKKTYYYTSVNNDIINTAHEIQFIGANNTGSYSINEDFNLISLISSKTGKASFEYEDYATNSDLFVSNSTLTGYTFNCGKELEYNIEIKDCGSNSATISITYR